MATWNLVVQIWEVTLLTFSFRNNSRCFSPFHLRDVDTFTIRLIAFFDSLAPRPEISDRGKLKNSSLHFTKIIILTSLVGYCHKFF